MKRFKCFLVISVIALCAIFIAPSALAFGPESQNIGAKLGYVSKNESILAGFFYQRKIHRYIRLSPELAFVLRHQDLDAVKADLNFHVPIIVSDSHCCLYPICGINYSRWHHAHVHNIFGDYSKNYSKLGLNLGAGFEIYTNRNLKVSMEWKYTFTRHFTTTLLDLGVGYFF